MARSSKVDAIEKFRFGVFIFDLNLSLAALAKDTISFLRGGFSDVTLPRQTTTAMEYRENLDAAHPQLIPGITRYDSVFLRRGVTNNSDFLRWASAVHDANQFVASAIQSIRGDSGAQPPSESLNFRKDVVIVIYNRSGNPEKAWLLRNAWVASYKPGDDLSALSGEKLIEEIELRYECFEELSKDAAISGAINDVLGAFDLDNFKL